MEKKQSSQRRKPPGGAAAPGASKSVTVMEPAGKPSARDSKTSRDDSARKQNRDGSFFNSIRSPKRQYFTIHPEWVSENLSVSRMTLKEKTQTYPPRRCKSAPPPRSRNPITWLSEPRLAEAPASMTGREVEPKIKPQKASRQSKVNYDGTFFSGVRTPKRECFTVHPEWASEGRSYARQSQRSHCRTNTIENIYGKRSQSAPALRSRNPITWD